MHRYCWYPRRCVSKISGISYSSTAVTDKMVLGGQVIMYSNLIDPCTVATNKYNKFSILGRNKYFGNLTSDSNLGCENTSKNTLPNFSLKKLGWQNFLSFCRGFNRSWDPLAGSQCWGWMKNLVALATVIHWPIAHHDDLRQFWLPDISLNTTPIFTKQNLRCSTSLYLPFYKVWM